MMPYTFLFLSLLFLIPGMIIYVIRPDLRRVIHVMALFSIPFAFTEQLFYPTYWEPEFLFDLVNVIGFGIEDILFVIGLASFTSTAYAVTLNKRYESISPISFGGAVKRGVAFLTVAFAGVVLLFSIDMEMIYGSVLIMVLCYSFVVIRRNDLVLPGLLGGIVSLIVYTALCLILMLVYPAIFRLTWHAEQFFNIFIFGIPLEEILYAFAAGLIATVFYPYISYCRFRDVPKSADSC